MSVVPATGSRSSDQARSVSCAALTHASRRVRAPGRGTPSREAERYARAHGGHGLSEFVTAPLDLERPLVPAGWLRAISYHTDKAERAERDPADYRHGFEGEARPLVCVTGDGRGLVVLSDRDLGPVRYGEHDAPRFGRYTVTPHGIEDIA